MAKSRSSTVFTWLICRQAYKQTAQLTQHVQQAHTTSQCPQCPHLECDCRRSLVILNCATSCRHQTLSIWVQLAPYLPSSLGCCSYIGSGSSFHSADCCCCDAEYSSGVKRRRWVGAVKSLPPDSKALCEVRASTRRANQ